MILGNLSVKNRLEMKMPRAFDGTSVPERLKQMNCGGTPVWDYPSACSYRCDVCMAVIGSISQSDRCKKLNEQGDENSNLSDR